MGTAAGPAYTPEFAATFRELLLEVMAKEIPTTGKVFAALPAAAQSYRPDAKSRTAWELAWHVAADVWFLEGIAQRAFEMNPDQAHPNPCQTGAELAEWYARRSREALEKLRAMRPTELVAPLTLGGVAEQTQVTFPAFVYLLWSHLHTVHHRGQLSAYLRPMGAKVPAIYGPSADEPSAG